MSTHKNVDKICVVAVVLALLVCILFMNADTFGVQAVSREMGYENRLFDNSKVHTIDIVMDNWDEFIADCQSEEYYDCTVVIDDETYRNVAIRGKGNTSQIILWPEIPQQAQKNYRPYHTPHKQRYRNPVQNRRDSTADSPC